MMKNKRVKNILLKSFSVVGFCMVSFAAQSAVIPSLFGTGLDAAGNPLAQGQDDPHYTVNENGGAFAQTYIHPSYFPNNSTSQWIWQSGSGAPGNVIRTFKTSFDLTGFDASTVVLNGLWGADNQGLDILLNGNSTGINLLGVVVSNFTSLTPYTISSGFVSGINTLEFIIQDNGAPGAFRTEFSASGVIATPIPAAVWLFGSGLLGLVGVARRK